MRKFVKIYGIFLGGVALLVLVVPFLSLAEEDSISIWPVGYWGPLVACGGEPCDSLCDLVDLGQRLTAFGISLIVFAIAPVMLVYGGMKVIMAGGSIERLNSGKGIIKGAVIGIALGLGSYLILSTFLWALGIAVGPGGAGVNWPNIQCKVEGVSDAGGGGPSGGGEEGSHAYNLKVLNQNGVQVVSSGNCSDPSRPECTSLDGLDQAAIDGLIRAKDACGCNLVVTAGTETGHETHGMGKAIVDIDNNPGTDAYVYSQINTSNPSLNTWYTGEDGTFYFYEGDHWHVCYDFSDCPHSALRIAYDII